MFCREVNPCGVVVAKASLNRALSWQDLDPKRSDLSLARLKHVEERVEDRTHLG